MFTKTNPLRKESIVHIVLNNLKEKHDADAKAVRDSHEFKTFEADLIKSNKEAALLNSAFRTYETAINTIHDLLKFTDHVNLVYKLKKDEPFKWAFDRLCGEKKEDAFPVVYRCYNGWHNQQLAEAYYELLKEEKNDDKLIAKIIGKF